MSFTPKLPPELASPLLSAMSLTPHLQQIKERAEKFQSQFPLADNFPPSLSPDDGTEIAQLVSRSISYYYTTKVFIKRQPHPDELGTDISGRPAVNPYIASRLRNEAAVLQFVAKHTTIPVPKLLALWKGEDSGLVYLKTRPRRNRRRAAVPPPLSPPRRGRSRHGPARVGHPPATATAAPECHGECRSRAACDSAEEAVGVEGGEGVAGYG